MSLIGRKLGFIYASIGTCFASLLTAYSIIVESFVLYNLGCFLIGGGIAFSHQYRFAAVEVVDKDYACLLYTSPSPRDVEESRMPSSA